MKWAPYLHSLCSCALALSALTVHLNSSESATWYSIKCARLPHGRGITYWSYREREREGERERERGRERGVGAVAGYVSVCAINHWHSYTLEQLVHSEVTYNIMDSLWHALSAFPSISGRREKPLNEESNRRLTGTRQSISCVMPPFDSFKCNSICNKACLCSFEMLI